MSSSTPARKHHWAILGGGIMGISLAEQLIARGQQVTLIEAGSQLGGLADGWQVGDVKWDRFYHVTLLSDSKLRDLLSKIGLDEHIRWVTTKTGFYSGGQLYSMSNSFEFLTFPVLNPIEKLRLGATIFYASKIRDWQRLEQIPVTEWLQKTSGRGTFEKVWLPLLKAKLGSAYDRVSAAFIWAYISRMYKARRSGLKTEMFGYVPGGYSRVMAALRQRLYDKGVELCFGAKVANIRSDSDKIAIETDDKQSWRFDRVIATLPSSSIPRLVPQLLPDEKDSFDAIKYLGVICASFVLKQPLSQFYVTNITDTWVPMTAVIEMSTVVDAGEFGGKSLVYLPKYFPAGDTIATEDDDTIIDRFVDALERMYPTFSREMIIASRVARANQVMAIPGIGYSQTLPKIKTSLPGLYVLNSAHITSGTLNVNESIELADEKFANVIWPDSIASD